MKDHDNNKKTLYEFLKEHPAAHLATVNPDGKPFISTVYFYANSMAELFIATLSKTEKYKNIQADSHVALVVTDEDAQKTVQITGTASEEQNPAVKMAILEQLATLQARNKSGWPPPIVKLDKGQLRLIKVIPTWVRLSDFKNPENVIQFETT